jgi:hypothetical protein
MVGSRTCSAAKQWHYRASVKGMLALRRFCAGISVTRGSGAIGGCLVEKRNVARGGLRRCGRLANLQHGDCDRRSKQRACSAPIHTHRWMPARLGWCRERDALAEDLKAGGHRLRCVHSAECPALLCEGSSRAASDDRLKASPGCRCLDSAPLRPLGCLAAELTLCGSRAGVAMELHHLL